MSSTPNKSRSETLAILAKLDRLPPLGALPTWTELARYGMTTIAEVKRDAREVHGDLYGYKPTTDEDAREVFAMHLRRAERRLREMVRSGWKPATAKRAA